MCQKEKLLEKYVKKHTYMLNTYEELEIFDQIIVVQLVQTEVVDQSHKGQWKLVDDVVLYVISGWKHSIDGDGDNVEKMGRIATSFEVGERQGNIN